MSEQTETKTGWLDNDQLSNIRANIPLVYVDAVPVRVDEVGRVTRVGLLLRQAADGSLSRMVVSGRVMFGETRCCATSKKTSARWPCRRYHPTRRRSPWSSTSPTPM